MYDVMIIGAGVTGSAIARELMRKKRKVAVLERCSDICEGTSKANSGIVHAGFDATPGTLKAKHFRRNLIFLISGMVLWCFVLKMRTDQN